MKNFNYSALDYISVVRKLIDDVIWTTLEEEYEYDGPLAQRTNWFDDLFDHSIYNIEGTNSSFHNPKFVKFLEEYTQPTRLPYEEAVSTANQVGKQIFLQMAIHPRGSEPMQIKKYFFDKLFEKHPEIINLMKEGKLVLLLYFGWEADNFEHNGFENSETNTYYNMFDTVFYDYPIPRESIIILSSNKKGYMQENKNYGEDLRGGEYTRVIYENVSELSTFRYQKGEWNPEYTFDEYIKNIEKEGIKKLLRINRTQLGCRDFMLYWLENTKYINESIVEHRLGDKQFAIEGPNMFHKELSKEWPGDDSPPDEDYFSLKYYLRTVKRIAKNLGYKNIIPHLNFDENILNKILESSPYIASENELMGDFRNLKLGEGRYSNEVIPVDVYYNSIFSWVSTSLTDRRDQVFINASTFQPILHYHPIVFNSNESHNRYMMEDGFKSYNWFTEPELVDITEGKFPRMAMNLKEITRLMKMPTDRLIGTIKDNRESLEYNRNLLFECKSIENIIKKLYVIVNEKYMNGDGTFDELNSYSAVADNIRKKHNI
tara:strand:+ start:45 stop:1676 length:1632 start_codon:yes stop_codon:yes gene_type:complete